MSVANAAEVMREAVKKHSTWYLVQSALMILAGALALLFPSVPSTAVAFYVGWLLIISGVLQAIGLIDAHDVPHFWLQLLSVVLFMVVGLLILRLGNIVGSSILHPETGRPSLTLLLAVLFMVEGFSKVIFSLTIRPLPSWSWVFGSGIVGNFARILPLDEHSRSGAGTAWRAPWHPDLNPISLQSCVGGVAQSGLNSPLAVVSVGQAGPRPPTSHRPPLIWLADGEGSALLTIQRLCGVHLRGYRRGKVGPFPDLQGTARSRIADGPVGKTIPLAAHSLRGFRLSADCP